MAASHACTVHEKDLLAEGETKNSTITGACKPAIPDLDEDYFGNESSNSNSSTALQPLDEKSFPSFAPLLSACQEYARFSGCRFSLKAFEGIEHQRGACVPIVNDTRAGDAGPLLAAKLCAAIHVRSYAELLKSGEADLLQDSKRAHDIAIKESARNSMIAICKAADFFPPSPSPEGVDDEDHSWDEVGLASAPVIAQRLYNDEVHRQQGLAEGGAGCSALIQAKTASFLVDFADEVGAELPQTAMLRTEMLEQFHCDVQGWAARSEQPPPRKESALHNLLEDGRATIAMADRWLEKGDNKKFLLSFAVVGFVGLAVHVAANTASSVIETNGSRRDDLSRHGRV